MRAEVGVGRAEPVAQVDVVMVATGAVGVRVLDTVPLAVLL